MELLQLYYFRTVAEVENMTKAAELLRVSQPSLSKTISRLEESLGAQLFVRNGRRIRLSRQGDIFLKHVKRVFYELDEGRRSVAIGDAPQETTVSLSTNIPYAVTDAYIGFQDSHPDILCVQYCEDRQGIKAQLEDGLADIAVFSSEHSLEGFDCAELFEDELLVVVTNTYPAKSGVLIDLNDLAEERIYTYPRGNPLRDKIDVMFEDAGIHPQVVFEDMNPLAQAHMSGKGAGITFTTKFAEYSIFCNTERKAVLPLPETRLLRLSNPDSKWSVYMTKSKHQKNPELATLLYDYLREYFTVIAGDIDTVIRVLLL